MDVLARRALLATEDNPDIRFDYIVSLSGALKLGRVELRYIPDRVILTKGAFATYLTAFDTLEWRNIEAAAICILTDLSNELVARWVQVSLKGGSSEEGHHVVLEDRQPRWDNARLLARLSAS
jgi:7-cyano-7-deazaguanine reductase